MGEADRYHEYRKSSRRNMFFGDSNNALMALFAINVVFFLVLLLIQVTYSFMEQSPEAFSAEVLQWFELPAGLKKLSERPWTILTYMFSDSSYDIIRLLSNMIWLWAFGYLLQHMAGNDKLIPIYIYGGLVGGLFFITAHYLIPPLRVQATGAGLMGANAGVLAVAMATTTLSPDYRFFTQIRNGIPIWVLMGIYVFIDLAGIAGRGAAYSLSHLGGVLAGFLFVLFLRKGKDGSVWMNRMYHWVMNLFNPAKPSREKIKETVFYNSGNRKPYSKTTNITQQKVDEILDKINQKGYHFLTDEEKDILKKAAEDDSVL